MATKQIIPTAARRHPATNTRFRFRPVTAVKRSMIQIYWNSNQAAALI